MVHWILLFVSLMLLLILSEPIRIRCVRDERFFIGVHFVFFGIEFSFSGKNKKKHGHRGTSGRRRARRPSPPIVIAALCLFRRSHICIDRLHLPIDMEKPSGAQRYGAVFAALSTLTALCASLFRTSDLPDPRSCIALKREPSDTVAFDLSLICSGLDLIFAVGLLLKKNAKRTHTGA